MNYDYLSSASMSDVGQRRKNNQDSEVRIPDAGIFCVADGMGGGDAGEIASSKVTAAIKKFADGLHEDPGVDNLKYKIKYLSRTLISAGEEIFHFAQSKGYHSCGTTAVVLAFDFNQPKVAGILHVGDSRLYRLRNRELKQITVDHSAQNEVDLGDRELPESMKHVITRAVGVFANTQVEETHTDVEVGDLFLICSDGLSGMVPDTTIQEILIRNIDEPPGHSVQDLIAAANQAGGKDNITACLIRVREHPGFHQDLAPLEPYEMAEDEEDTADRTQAPAPRSSADETQNLGGHIHLSGMPEIPKFSTRAAPASTSRSDLSASSAPEQPKSLAFIWIPIFIIVAAFALYMTQQEMAKRAQEKQSADQWISDPATSNILPDANPDNPALQTPLNEFK